MNAKGDLIAWLLARGRGTPLFEATSHGPAHDRSFRVQVLVGGRVLGEGGEGRSKREAERLAAEAALQTLRLETQGAGPEEQPVRQPAPRWPIYAGLLEGALTAALDLSPGDATLDEVRRDAARLYRDLLADLGHGPEAG